MNSDFKSHTIKDIDYLIWGLFASLLLTDTINGYFFNNNIYLPISQTYKIILLLLIYLRTFFWKESSIINCIQLLYVSFLITYLAINDLNINETINTLFKYLTIIITFNYVSKQLKNRTTPTFSIYKHIIFINLIVIILNVFIGLLGFGYYSYGEDETGIGFKGFFNAANEVSGLILVIYPFTLFHFAIKYGYKSKQYILIALILFSSAVLMGTKTSMIAVLITLVCLPYLQVKKTKNSTKKLLKNLTFLFISICFISLIIYYIIDDIGLLDRWIYFWDKHDGNIISFLLSGRDDFWEFKKQIYLNANSIELLFGFGCWGKGIEVDFLDALFNFGIIGFIIIYSSYAYLVINSYRLTKNNDYPYSKIVFFTNILILCSSSISGHILFSGMINNFIAIINSIAYYRISDWNNKNNDN